MALPTKVYDLYAPILNYKNKITELKRPFVTESWIPESHERRIQAYDVLAAYNNCYSRDYRNTSAESGVAADNDKIIETGNAEWLCLKFKNKLLGGELSITVPVPKKYGNEETLKNLQASILPDLKAYAIKQLAVLNEMKARLSLRESYLQGWFQDEMIALKIDENEETCSFLGDCCYYVQWNTVTGVPEIITYDPGTVFPYFNLQGEVSLEDEKTPVSDRVFVAWEEIADEFKDDKVDDKENAYTKLFRDTYELRMMSSGKRCFRQKVIFKHVIGDSMQIWQYDDKEFYNDQQSLKWEDLGIDFIPIVWIPNMVVQGDVFGKSNIHTLIPTLDSLMNTDTDLGENSEHLGGATVFVSGKDIVIRKDSVTKEPLPVPLQPRTILPLGEGGRMDLLDTSTMQEALLKTGDKTLKDFIRLSEITEAGAGMIKPSDIPSGVALRILMQPLLDKINPRRMHRQNAYKALFYCVQRLYQIYGNQDEKAIFADPLTDALIQFGAILPSDDSTMLDYYTKLMDLLDEETVLEMMKEDGYQFDIATIMQRRQEKKKAAAQAQADLFTFRRAKDESGGTTVGQQ